MNIEARGAIDKFINTVYQKQNMIDTLNWLSEKDKDIENFEDLAMGYFFGSIVSEASQLAANWNFIEVYERRWKKYLKDLEKNSKRKMQTITPKLSNEETEEIKDILKKWIPQFREKIKKEIAVLRLNLT